MRVPIGRIARAIPRAGGGGRPLGVPSVCYITFPLKLVEIVLFGVIMHVRRLAMIWSLKDLFEHRTQVEINGRWVPARPLNWKLRSWQERFRDAWAVFTGRAAAFRWPEGQ